MGSYTRYWINCRECGKRIYQGNQFTQVYGECFCSIECMNKFYKDMNFRNHMFIVDGFNNDKYPVEEDTINIDLSDFGL